jgi:hypothetical protein
LTKEIEEYLFPLTEVDVRAHALDEFFEELGQHPLLLKLDCQGGELEVLRGAESLLRNSRPVLIELETSLLSESFYKGAPNLKDMMAFLFDLGYELLELNVIERGSTSKLKQRGIPHECDAVFALKLDDGTDIPVDTRWALFLAYVEYGYFALAHSMLLFDEELANAMATHVGKGQFQRLLRCLA